MTSFDPIRILNELDDQAVLYVLIGGAAATALGSPIVTQDIDICYERSSENLQRLANALRSLNAKLRGAPADVPFPLDARTLEMGDQFTFTTDAGSLDIMATPAGSGGYEQLSVNALEVDLDGLTVRTVAIEDLIRMKRAAGRPKDLALLEELGALEEEREKR